MKQIFGPKTDENEKWRRLYNEELHSLYHSPNTVRVIKSRRLRWTGHIARMEEGRNSFKILTGRPPGKRFGLDVGGRTVLDWCQYEKLN